MQINRVPQKKKKKKKKKVKRTSCRKPIRADQSPTAVPPISQSLDRKIRAESCRVALAFFFTRLFVVSPSFFFIRNIPITFCWLWVSLGWTGQRHVLSLMLLNLYLPSIMASYLPAIFFGSFQSFPRLFCAFSFLGLTKFHWPYLIETIFFLEAFTWLVLTSFYWVFHRFGRPYFYVFFLPGFLVYFFRNVPITFCWLWISQGWTGQRHVLSLMLLDPYLPGLMGIVYPTYQFWLSFESFLVVFFFFLTSLLLMIVLLFNTRTGGSLAFGRPALGRLRPASIDQKKNQTNKRNKKTKEKETDGAEETTKTTTTIKKCN